MSLFDKAKDRFFKGEIDLEAVTLKLLLVSGTLVDLAVADTLADIPVIDRVATETQTGGSLVNGLDPDDLWFIGDDIVFPAVSGAQVIQAVLYLEGPSEILSPLILANNVNYTPVGTNISVEWGSNIFEQACEGTNDFYFEGKKSLYKATLDLSANDIHAVLVDNTYAFDITDLTLADIGVGSRVGDVQGYSLANKLVGLADAIQAGTFDADDVVIPALAGDPIEAIVLIKFLAGTPELSPLIAFFDEGMNFPLTPDGSTTGIVWSNLANRILNI